MAVFRPSLHDLHQLVAPLNPGELAVAEALAGLDDDWTVYIQARIGQDVPDLIAVHDRYGVCAIEVKDWNRAGYRQADDGAIEHRDAAGGWHRVTQQPRYQAHRYRSTIFDQFFALPGDGDQPTAAVRAAVVLPQYSNADAAKLLARACVSQHERSIAVWGGDGMRQSVEHIVRGRGCPPPRPESIRRLKRHLAESQILTELRSPVALSRDARNIESNPNNARVRRVRGPAGCGKSFGLAARAARLAAGGKRVLVLSYNVTLSNYLRLLVNARCQEYAANPTLVTCTSFHGLCHRAVDDARRVGMDIPLVTLPRFEADVVKARHAMAAGHGPQFDAVLVDEGQDFTLEWWNMLRHHVVTADGEMLLVADPTQDVYENRSWTDEDEMRGAGFSGPWTELKGSYRMPGDVVPLANAFAQRYLSGERLAAEHVDDHDAVVGRDGTTIRRWRNVDSPLRLGAAIGDEVVRLLADNPELLPGDVVFLCEDHRAGLAAVNVIEGAGHSVHHVFSEHERSRARRKRRFWPDADGIKGCTVHSFKGWETPALVMGIGRSQNSRRLAYVAMTRLTGRSPTGVGFLSVVNSDLHIAGFQSTFEQWAPPRAEMRVS